MSGVQSRHPTMSITCLRVAVRLAVTGVIERIQFQPLLKTSNPILHRLTRIEIVYGV